MRWNSRLRKTGNRYGRRRKSPAVFFCSAIPGQARIRRFYKAGSLTVTDDSRLETLEIKVAWLEETIQQLSDELFRQQRTLEQVVSTNRQLAEQIESLEARADVSAEPPPHY
ncbi:MAG TPA: SlyX family protein [Chromatiales bacterium]|nr:SlyX family protein [Chromatiales bacterium]